MDDMRERSIRWRLLRAVLPARFAERYADQLLLAHVDRARMTGAGPMRFWVGLAADVFITTAQLRTDRRAVPVAAAGRRLSHGEFMLHTLRFAFRSLARARGFSAAVILTMALGIGSTATLFTLTDRLLLSAPPHVAEPEGLRRVFVHGIQPFTRSLGFSETLTYPDFVDLSLVPGMQIAGRNLTEMTIGDRGRTERARIEFATASYFPILGVRPVLGRFLTEHDDQIGAPLAAVLSYGYWQRQFGGDPDAIGELIRVGRGSYTIVGVAPSGFTGVDVDRVEAWLPLRAANATESGTGWTTSRRWYWISAIARIEPERQPSVEAAATRAYRLGRESIRNDDRSANVVLASVIGGRGPEATNEARIVPALGGLALMVLLLCCANVANLFLARGVQRRRTFAIQTAVGLSRSRLVAVSMAEVTLLALAGGIIGLMVTNIATPVLFRTLLPTAAVPASTSLRLAAFLAMAIGTAAIIAGLAPALRSTRVDAFEALRFTRESRHGSSVRRSLLFAQAALCAFLLVGAGMFLRSFQAARELDMGVDLSTLVVQLELADGSRFGDAVAQAAYMPLERVRALPSVASASLTSIPHFYGNWGVTLMKDGDSVPNTARGPFFYGAGGQYFETIGLPILRGRPLADADDREGAAPVAVVSNGLARLVYGTADPVGRCLNVNSRDRCTTVVGVAEDALPAVRADSPNYNLYLPPHHPDAGLLASGTIVVRARGDIATTAREVQRAVLESGVDIRMVEVKPLAAFLDHQLRAWRLGSTLLTAFGALALLVAVAGIFSSLSFDVAQRRFELSVRAALGASAGALIRTSALRSLAVCGAGVVLGLSLATALSVRAASLLFHVSPLEPWVLGNVLAVMTFAIIAAAAIPAWRALRSDPKIAMESE
jgi:predicted permease